MSRRDSRINWSEFSGGNQHAQGIGALALGEEADGAALVQPGAEMALGEPDSSLATPAWKLLRIWSQTLYQGAWWEENNVSMKNWNR